MFFRSKATIRNEILTGEIENFGSSEVVFFLFMYLAALEAFFYLSMLHHVASYASIRFECGHQLLTSQVTETKLQKMLLNHQV